MERKKTVLLCVTGGIAAYKIATLASMLVKTGYDVKVVMTQNATNFINPLLSLIFTGGPGDISDGVAWTFGAAFASFLTTVVNFFITALVLFVLLKGINALMSIGKKPAAPAAPTTKKGPYCLSEIPIKATRCPHCTSVLDKK